MPCLAVDKRRGSSYSDKTLCKVTPPQDEELPCGLAVVMALPHVVDIDDTAPVRDEVPTIS
jgi:hypothetical protein